MAEGWKYDDSELQALWKGLSEKERRKALRSSMRNLGKDVKKVVIDQFHKATFKGGPFDYHTQMNKIVRVQVMTKALGFSVTIKPTAGKQRKK